MVTLRPAILSLWSVVSVSTTLWESIATLARKDIMEMQSWAGPMTATPASAPWTSRPTTSHPRARWRPSTTTSTAWLQRNISVTLALLVTRVRIVVAVPMASLAILSQSVTIANRVVVVPTETQALQDIATTSPVSVWLVWGTQEVGTVTHVCPDFLEIQETVSAARVSATSTGPSQMSVTQELVNASAKRNMLVGLAVSAEMASEPSELVVDSATVILLELKGTSATPTLDSASASQASLGSPATSAYLSTLGSPRQDVRAVIAIHKVQSLNSAKVLEESAPAGLG